jgi:hypothetical protein
VFLLDTNIVSEIVKRAPDAKVLARLDSEPPGSLHISSVTVFEFRPVNGVEGGELVRLKPLAFPFAGPAD